ncbi:MAG: hypothetical protein D6705_01815 [Deltaproteobacteria bacterium]|nr:MAG: hypothetical protein D6705_01815 [Deltaproteobacteria bacterium]
MTSEGVRVRGCSRKRAVSWRIVVLVALATCHRDVGRPVDVEPDVGQVPAGESAGAGTEPATPPRHLAEDPRGVRALDLRLRGKPYGAPLREIWDDAGASPPLRAQAAYLLGQMALEEERPDEAAALLAHAVAAPSLAPIEDHVRLALARARAEAGDLAGARAAFEAGPFGPEIEAEARSERARLLLRMGDASAAVAAAEALLDRGDLGRRRHEIRVLLAEALEARGASGDLERARKAWEEVLLAVPASAFGEKARARLDDLERTLGPARRGRARRTFETRIQLALARDLLARRAYARAFAAAAPLARDRKVGADVRCEAAYVAGTSLFKRRKRVDAVPWFRRAVRVCPDDEDGRDLRVRSAYQAARGVYADGAYRKAARAFESLATRHGDHRLADDAWILAAESHAEAGNVDAAEVALRRAARAGGDMAFEAVRRLVVTALDRGDVASARDVLDGIGADIAAGPEDRAALAYLRARVAEAAGEADAASAYLAVFDVQRIGYYPLLAYSRCVALGRGDAALKKLDAPSRATAPVPPDGPADLLARVELLAVFGAHEAAAKALEAAGIRGWDAAFVLARIGAHARAQRVVAGLASSLAEAGRPDGPWRPALEVAHPRPFRDWVEGAAGQARIPPDLLYAFAQTESRFDPHAVSWAGARGIVQLMPKTAAHVAARHRLDAQALDLHDPVTNLRLAAYYVADQMTGFGGRSALPLAIAAYNAGPGAVRRWRRSAPDRPLDLFVETIPYDETRRYTKRVLGRFFAYRWIYGGELPVVLAHPEAEGPGPDR